MDMNIKRIKDKIEHNGVYVNEAISKEKIREFEKKNNICLPEELKLFYSEIGNGCKMIDGYYLRKFEELVFDIYKVKEEFIFTNYWIWEDDDNEDFVDKVEKGNIQLIDIGDGQSWNIIITGKERGQMWLFTDIGIQPCAPRRGFLSWFEYWLDGNDDYFKEFKYD
ncbi:MAG TPA: SMI1/KNR4 family protein [Candidatus Scybalomonas excrementigallinarum]|nr:SMI1/KNR4 family protein [Candidatus Scybalomonas excrementigallinarum]